jgi:hypothetical protein
VVTIFSDYIKKDIVLRRDSHQVAIFVEMMLPYLVEQPAVFPLIYSDPKVCVSNVHAHHNHANF